MWARTVEVMLGFWLAASPYIFRHPADEPGLWWNDFGTAFVILTISLLSFWSRTIHAHLLNIPVCALVLAFGYFGSGDPHLPPRRTS